MISISENTYKNSTKRFQYELNFNTYSRNEPKDHYFLQRQYVFWLMKTIFFSSKFSGGTYTQYCIPHACTIR